jgi:hypothetical protein
MQNDSSFVSFWAPFFGAIRGTIHDLPDIPVAVCLTWEV